MNPRSSMRGFTLMELLAALAISGILISIAAALLHRSLGQYMGAAGQVDGNENARVGWSQLVADLSMAKFHDGAIFQASDANRPSCHVGFLRALPDDMQQDSQRIADLGAAHYYLADQQIDGKTVRCLMRGVRESKETFEALKADETGALFEKREATDEPVVLGVIAFDAKPKRWDHGWIEWTADYESPPTAIAVRLVIVKSELRARLTSSSEWDGAGRFQEQLGDFSEAANHPQMESFSAILAFGSHHEN